MDKEDIIHTRIERETKERLAKQVIKNKPLSNILLFVF